MVRLVHLFLRTEISCLEVDICDPNASCQHEEPLAKCVCNPGYEGDGTTCSPIGASVIFIFFFSIFVSPTVRICLLRASTNAGTISFLRSRRSSARIHIASFCIQAHYHINRKNHDREAASVRPVIISNDIKLACVPFDITRDSARRENRLEMRPRSLMISSRSRRVQRQFRLRGK